MNNKLETKKIWCQECGALLAILYETDDGSFYESVRSKQGIIFDYGLIRCACQNKTHFERVDSKGLIEKIMVE